MTGFDDDFAAMFEASEKAKRLERGQTIEGRIVGLGADVAFVDVGGKGEALIDIEELKQEDGSLEVKVGDRIQAVVVSTADGVKLSRRLARRAATARHLEDAYRTGLPVEGRVERTVKGGFEIRIGQQRAFCPFSQIDIVRTDNAVHEGRVYDFRIVEFGEDGRNIVVSRRALLEAEQREAASRVRDTLVPDAVVTGHVASVREYGAFIELGGGIQGLLHASDMAWSRVDPSQVVKPGDSVTVKVLRVDSLEDGSTKIALGLKQLQDDPWSTAATRYEVGQVRTGRVTRVAEFGAFVELEPGIEALAHASTFPPTGQRGGWAAQVPKGLTAPFEVLSVEPDRRRIGVALVPEGSARASGAGDDAIAAGARLIGKVERHEKFGVFVYLAPGRTGLVPLSETGIAREGDVVRAFPVGSDVEVVVLEVDETGRRIRLSARAVQDAKDAAEVEEYAERQRAEAPSGAFGGSLADKLRGALDGRKR